MGFYFRRRTRLGKGSWLNFSKSGISASKRVGPFTFNSRGRTSVRLGKGVGYRGGCATVLVLAVGSLAFVAALLANLVTLSP
ncbi:MAG: DUF4236 domain-containing protein [Ilumatobacteraceae bacterium]